MPLEKPKKPTELVPRAFGGIKNNFSDDLQSTGFEPNIPQTYNGDNLNYHLDATGKELDYVEKVVDYINQMPVGGSLYVNANNQLDYIDVGSFADKADKDLVNTGRLTNCWTKIPQRIKYTLEDGTLTILAGSVLIFPYGTQDLTAQYPIGSEFLSQYYIVADTYWDGSKFFVWAEAQRDYSVVYGGVNTDMMLTAYGLGGYQLTGVKYTTSGTTAPSTSSSRQFWYDTTNNYVKNYGSNTTEFSYNSLPLMLIDCIEVNKFKIKHTFNGWGYIGAVRWWENLEGLISNGYNDDGTYKNIVIKTPKITMESYANTTTRDFIIFPNGEFNSPDHARCFYQEEEPNITGTASNNWYNPKTNKTYNFNGTNWVEYPNLKLYTYNTDGTNVTAVTDTPQTFRPLEYSDKAMISSWGMPSNNYIDLTLGASGTEYTAPANGWVTVWKKATASNQYLHINNNLGLGWTSYSTGNGSNLVASLPLAKNQKFKVSYSAGGDVAQFRFIYAEGEQ